MTLSVAIVGAGPAGLYTADALAESHLGCRIDLIDELPAPFGLLRYGVAPDHLKMKSLEVTLQRILDRPEVRFFGNVRFGRDVGRSDLLSLYDAVVYANGAGADRQLNIPGENLRGSVGSRQFVHWYNAHPACRFEPEPWRLRRVAIIGAGNVALDVARVLAKPASAFEATDVPEPVLQFMRTSPLTDIYILARGRPAQARFTSKELRELGQIEGVTVTVDARDLTLTQHDEQLISLDGNVARNLETLRGWTGPVNTSAARRIHFRFNSRPVEILGNDSVEGIRIQESDDADRTSNLAVDAVFHCIGYIGSPLPEVPFDPHSGTIPNAQGRVLHGSAVSRREYVTGWSRRGARGVLGTNKSDGAEVARAILEDASSRQLAATGGDLEQWLISRNIEAVTLRGWNSICAVERELGAQASRRRIKLSTQAELLAASRAT